MITAAADPTIASTLTDAFGDAFAMFGPFAGPLGMLFVVGGLCITIQGLWTLNRGYMMGGSQKMLTGVVFAGMGLALGIFGGGKDDSGSKTAADKPAPKPTETSAPDVSDQGGSGDPLSPEAVEAILTGVGIVLAVAVTLGVIAAVFFGIRHQRRKHAAILAAAEQARVEEEARLDRVWAEAVNRHDHVRDEMMRHQSDVDLVLSMPVINDQDDEKTAAFTRALAKAVDLAHDTRPSSAEAVNAYANATREAERAWGAAWRNADRVRLSQFSAEERATIKQVIKLMKRAEFETTPEARNSYYRKALKDLGNLIEIPAPAAEAIEQRIAGVLANPAADTPEPILTPTAARLLAGRAREALSRVGAR